MSIVIDNRSREAVMTIESLHKLTKYGIQRASFMSSKGLMRTTSKEILRKPKGGRTYIRRDKLGRKRKHIASAAGETHANMSGKLRRSLGFKVNPSQIEFGYGVVKSDAPEHAGFVEFGTSKMAARPSLQNGMKDSRRDFQNNFEREIMKELK